MKLVCIRCNATFEPAVRRGYCDECVGWYQLGRTLVHMKQRPEPGVIADGKFLDGQRDCPCSVHDPVSDQLVCGLCGSDELEPGYGIGSGYGCGTYTFCFGCNSFLDFHEDAD